MNKQIDCLAACTRLVVAFAIAIGWSGEAAAVPEHSPLVVTASAVLIVLDGDVGAAKIPVNKGAESYLFLPTYIRGLSVTDLKMAEKFGSPKGLVGAMFGCLLPSAVSRFVSGVVHRRVEAGAPAMGSGGATLLDRVACPAYA